MFSKANIISTIVVAIWGCAGGFLLWGILGDSILSDHILIDNIMKDPPDMLFLILGCLIQAFAFSTIYGRWANGNFGIGSGVSFGIWMAILIGLGEKLIDFATSNIITLPGTFVNFMIYLLFFGITGLLTGIVYAKFR